MCKGHSLVYSVIWRTYLFYSVVEAEPVCALTAEIHHIGAIYAS